MSFKTEPRDFALALIEQGIITKDYMITGCLKYMSHDDVREMLDCNEMSPRFLEMDDEDEL